MGKLKGFSNKISFCCQSYIGFDDSTFLKNHSYAVPFSEAIKYNYIVSLQLLCLQRCYLGKLFLILWVFFVAECNRCQLRLVPCKRLIPSIYWTCSQVEFLVQQVSNRCAKEFTKTCSENGGALRNSQDIEINPYRARFPRYTY